MQDEMSRDLNWPFFMKDIRPEVLTSKAQKDMLAYWQSARADARIPPRTALDPAEFSAPSLPLLIVVQPVDGDDFKVRISGTEVRACFDREVTGLMLGEIDDMTSSLEALRWSRDDASPCFIGAKLASSEARFQYFTAIALPFGGPNDVERILMVLDLHHHDPFADDIP